MSSPRISDQNYALSASPDRESAISRDAARMMEKLNRKVEESGYKAYLGKSGTSGPSTASVDEYSDDDSSGSEEEPPMKMSEYSKSDGAERQREANKRQKKTNEFYNSLTSSVQRLFRFPDDGMVELTLKLKGIDVNLLQDLAKKCRMSHRSPKEMVHREIKRKGYPQEWASDMLQICVVSVDTLLVDVSNQANVIQDGVEQLQLALNKVFELRNLRSDTFSYT
ncbi:uncharacterized protein TRUGW13939_07618 [Talaromyces rugulosus]|uniref:Uncharacterized protein n=1 Tax=Talaromyces rugulosus TaxID=121627 RepID=A0A7H8R6L4_TALRU|nr:uncharacterized protein TRUGW13939_07618 [Talaromyces rugulosus]QKX60473.1 hypothetical protein TRUGW13939_07618 [Talaromyces rugulosus]